MVPIRPNIICSSKITIYRPQVLGLRGRGPTHWRTWFLNRSVVFRETLVRWSNLFPNYWVKNVLEWLVFRTIFIKSSWKLYSRRLSWKRSNKSLHYRLHVLIGWLGLARTLQFFLSIHHGLWKSMKNFNMYSRVHRSMKFKVWDWEDLDSNRKIKNLFCLY